MQRIELRQIVRTPGIVIMVAVATYFMPLTVRAQWTNGTNINNTNTGNVGIGTTTPATLLDIRGSGVASRVTGTGASGTHGKFQIYFSDISNNPFAEMQFYAPTGAGSEYLRFNIGNSSGNVFGDAFTINRLANVGIGMADPQFKLDVAGNINSSATITGNNIVAKYQDVAEWVPSSEKLAAGTVVVLDATKSNQVIASSSAYDTRVAGVISSHPGITLGEKSDSKVLVATTGRVRVKVDASRGPIAIGDLLVTSDVPGVAMKSIPVEFAGRKMHMPGTIIGKALEPLAKGKGEILVLLSLQ